MIPHEAIGIKENEILADYEKYVGITGYSTNTPPIGGIIKLDIADFIVREILLSGEMLSTHEKTDSTIQYQSNKDKYTSFTLIKKNMDTIYAAKILQEYLNIPEKDISWAGIKDNTAITAQKFSVKGNFLDKLLRFQYKNITLTDIKPSNRPILLGHLWGNNFSVNIRKLKHLYTDIEPTINQWNDQISTTGFPNYYGLQRFGHHRPNSHLVGKLLFRQNYQEAVEEFLYKIYPQEYEHIVSIRKKLQNSTNYDQILNDLPNALYYEKLILKSLSIEPQNYFKAIQQLPSSLLHLILSAYQSFLFNKAVSQRIAQNIPISSPVKGDIVSILMEERGQTSLVSYKFGGLQDDAILKAFAHERATIIAPVLGYKTNLDAYPIFKPIYEHLLIEEDFSIDQFKITIPLELRFEGTFRPIFQKPRDIKIEPAMTLNNSKKIDPNAIQLHFSLPKGTYATMLLRELIKT